MKPWRHLTTPVLFLLGGIVAYSNILGDWFLSDDFVQIGKVLSGDHSVVWGQAQGGFFRPVFILSYIVDAGIWGSRAFGFHLTNVVIHSLNAFLTSFLTTRIIKNLKVSTEIKRAIAIAAGALFLLHPSHTEAVSWISGRADLLATFFCLASLWFYLAYVERSLLQHLILSVSCFAVALLAKESAICLPLLVVVLGSFAVARPGFKKLISVAGVYFSVLLVFIFVRSVFIGALVGGYGASQHLNFSLTWLRDRLLEASVRSVLPSLPWQLSRFFFKPLQSPVFILFALACIGMLVVAVWLRRRWYAPADRREQNRFILSLSACFLFSLLPVISLRLTLYQTQGERFLYLPTVFACLLMAYLAAIMVRKQALWLALVICALGFYGVRLYQTNRLWNDAANLSQSVTRELVDNSTRQQLLVLNAPDNLRGVPVFHNGLAEALRYFQSRKPFTSVEVLAYQDFQSLADATVISEAGNGSVLRATNQNDRFIRLEALPCFETRNQTETSFELQYKPCAADRDVFIFSEGKMTRMVLK